LPPVPIPGSVKKVHSDDDDDETEDVRNADDILLHELTARRGAMGQNMRAPRKIDDGAIVRYLNAKVENSQSLSAEEKHELKLAERRRREKDYRDAVKNARANLKSDDPEVVAAARLFLETPRKRGRPGAKNGGQESSSRNDSGSDSDGKDKEKPKPKPKPKSKDKSKDKDKGKDKGNGVVPPEVKVQAKPKEDSSSSSSDSD